MSDGAAYYVTTPIYYVNDSPHIGHAYTTLACDVLARFMRLDGHRVRFLTGTDEHGQKVDKAARAAGLDPKVFCDRVSENFRALGRVMNYSNDDFIRTTEPRHIRASQAIWSELKARGQIYLGSYAGWYSVRDETFYTEGELVDGKAPTGADVEWVEEPSYFFRLSAWQQPLLEHYAAHPDFIQPESRRNEMISFVSAGLHDLSISRTSFDWGVPVPDDPDHIMYVWLDALTNYITAVGYPDTDAADFEAFWPADLHMVGKDIVRFHTVYWPAFLMAAGLAPPKRVFAHGWWTIEGQKMSKSLGNVVDPVRLVERYGLDPVRYFLLREVPFGNDGDFSHRQMVHRMNGDLANDYGNLVQRVMAIVAKHCAGSVPEPGPRAAADAALLAAADGLLDIVRRHLAQQSFHKALEAVWEVVGAANRYVDDQAPWALRKSDPARMNTVLYVLMETIRHVALVTTPFMPGASSRILDQVGAPAEARDFRAWGDGHALRPGTVLPAPEGVFPRHLEPAEA